MTAYDIVFLGSSPNALTAAAYLAEAGKKVLVLEPSACIGGGVATTVEFAPGFRADLGLMSGRVAESVVRDLKLSRHGLEVIERDTITSLIPNGKPFTLPSNRAAAIEAINSLSPKDAAQYPKFMQLLALATDFLQAIYSSAPPQAHHPEAADVKSLTALVAKLRNYGRREMAEVIRLLVMPVRDFLEEWFESVELRGLLAGPGIRGLTQGPFAAGTTFNLLHHLAIGDAYFRATAKGGVGAIASALASAARAHGAEIRLNAAIQRIVVRNGVATGVTLGESGEVIDAATVVSDFDARRTFTELVDPAELEPEFNRAVRNIRYNGSVARINLALREAPVFKGLNDPAALKGTLVVSPSVDYLERAFDVNKRGAFSAQPYMEITVPTAADSTLAAAGEHVLSVWVQYAGYKSHVSSDSILETVIALLNEFAPNLNGAIVHKQVTTARDFEKQFNLTEGHLYGSDMTLAQALYMRPLGGFARYRTPIGGLYLCGSATHPGGGISGFAGSNLVKELDVKSVALTV